MSRLPPLGLPCALALEVRRRILARSSPAVICGPKPLKLPKILKLLHTSRDHQNQNRSVRKSAETDYMLNYGCKGDRGRLMLSVQSLCSKAPALERKGPS